MKAPTQYVLFIVSIMLFLCGFQVFAKDVPSARKIEEYRKAAQQGNADAKCKLGVCYAMGQGVVKDDSEAIKWYRKAAEQGNVDAQNSFGACYTIGQGVVKNDSEAVKWYRKAADQGHAGAQLNLGALYWNGDGVVKNEVEGYKWALLAAAQGNEAAKKNAFNNELRLSPAQRAEGQRLATEWQAKFEAAHPAK